MAKSLSELVHGCSIDKRHLCYCVQDKEPKGIIPLENVQVREVTASGHKPHCFEIHSSGNDVIKACKTDSEGKVVEGTSV